MNNSGSPARRPDAAVREPARARRQGRGLRWLGIFVLVLGGHLIARYWLAQHIALMRAPAKTVSLLPATAQLTPPLVETSTPLPARADGWMSPSPRPA